MAIGAFKDVSESISKRIETSPLGKQLTLDKPSNPKESYDSPIANKEVKEAGPPIQNKIDGCRREEEVENDLKKQYPPEQGYSIKREQMLRDKDGKLAADPKTGICRRLDYVVFKDGKVIDMIEVTSPTASKIGQYAKEIRIREAGGNYVKGPNGELVRIPNNIQTRIERRA